MDMRTLDHHLRMETLDIISATQLGAMGQHSRSASGHRHPCGRCSTARFSRIRLISFAWKARAECH
jgi:hypothetical protein